MNVAMISNFFHAYPVLVCFIFWVLGFLSCLGIGWFCRPKEDEGVVKTFIIPEDKIPSAFALAKTMEEIDDYQSNYNFWNYLSTFIPDIRIDNDNIVSEYDFDDILNPKVTITYYGKQNKDPYMGGTEK